MSVFKFRCLLSTHARFLLHFYGREESANLFAQIQCTTVNQSSWGELGYSLSVVMLNQHFFGSSLPALWLGLHPLGHGVQPRAHDPNFLFTCEEDSNFEGLMSTVTLPSKAMGSNTVSVNVALGSARKRSRAFASVTAGVSARRRVPRPGYTLHRQPRSRLFTVELIW